MKKFKPGMIVMLVPLQTLHKVVSSDEFSGNGDTKFVKPAEDFTDRYCNAFPEKFIDSGATFDYEEYRKNGNHQRWLIDASSLIRDDDVEEEREEDTAIVRAFKVANSIKTMRIAPIVMLKVTEEVGELAQEVSIAGGLSDKQEGADGVLGEAADVIISVIDVAYQSGYNADDLEKKILEKLEKWKKSVM